MNVKKTEVSGDPIVVDSPLPKKKVAKKKKAPVGDSAVAALKEAGVSVDTIKANGAIVSKFRRGLYPLDFTIKALEAKE